LIRKYVFDQFDDSYIATIGSKVTKKEIQLQWSKRNVNLKLMIWDLIGREGFHGLHARTIAGVHGAILVVDLTRTETLRSLERYWIPFLFKVVGNVPMVFACNKADLKDEFEFEPDEIFKRASKYNGPLEEILPKGLEASYSTSAKTGKNVQYAFESLGYMMLNDNKIVDPIKELYESLIVTGIQRNTDQTTTIGLLDSIIIDFCSGFEKSSMAMLILRSEIARAGIDINNPDKKGIQKLVDYLAEAENEYLEHEVVVSNMKKRHKWISKLRE
jgi:hypothetical protein